LCPGKVAEMDHIEGKRKSSALLVRREFTDYVRALSTGGKATTESHKLRGSLAHADLQA